MIKGQDFIVFSDDWGRHPSSCQHIFKRLIPGNKVLWVNTIGMRMPRLRKRDAKRIIEKFTSWFWQKGKKDENPVVFSPFMLSSFKSKFSRGINNALLTWQIRKICGKLKMKSPILVTTLPIASGLIGKLGEVKSVYYRVDDFSRWPGMMKETMAEMENDLFGKADLILAASDKLYENISKNSCPVNLLTHGVDFEHFMKAGLDETVIPEDISRLRRPIIGLCGSFDERTDFEVISRISSAHSDWSIVFVGQVLTGLGKLKRRKNIFFTGPRPYQELPNYLKAFDVCIMPYKVSDGSIFHSSPVKLKEYLASGKQVVSTPIPEVEKFRGVISIAKDNDEFVKSVESSFSQNSAESIKLRQHAVKNDSWDVKAEEFSRYVETVLRAANKKINVMHLRSVSGTGGGPEKTILLSAEKIDKNKFNMFVVYLKGPDDKDFGVTQKANGRDINYMEIDDNGKFDPNTLKKLKELIRSKNIDILHTHGYKSNFYGCILTRLCKVMLVTTTHGWIDNSLKERFYNWLDRKMIKTCSRVIAISDAMRKDLSRPGLNLDKLITIHNAIDTDDFNSNCAAQDLRAELKLDKNTSVIGVVGRLSKEKMINTLFDILPEIIARAEDIKLLIAGDGPQRSNLESAIRNSGLKDKVIFLGNVKDIKRVYKTMDLLVSISTTEGLPNNILEALSMEVPVVATRVGGVSEIIEDGVNGLLFSKADINGIKDGIVKLLLDKQTAVQLAASGRNLVCEKFSFDKRMRKMEKIYSQLVEKGK